MHSPPPRPTATRLPALGVIIAATGLSAGCNVLPRTGDSEFLEARTSQYEDDSFRQRDEVAQRFYDRLALEYEQCKPQPPVVDILALSSGGQFGAFGVGVLQGWNAVDDPALKRPEFDVVTGVSTGALIAPFALLGTDESIERIDRLYQQADDTLAVVRGILFFLPWQESFFDNTALAKRIDAEVDARTIVTVADAHEQFRMLFVGATDLDLGRFEMFDMGEEAGVCAATGDYSRFRRMLLASASIPAAFPPVDLDGVLYADGAASQAAFIGLDRAEIVDTVRTFCQRTNSPPPHIRMWIIVNGPLDPRPSLAKRSWTSVATRSLETLTSYSMRTTLRHLEFGCELLSHDIGGTVDFRYVAVPDAFPLPKGNESMFDPKLMAELRDLGLRMGADPASWQSTVGAPEMPNSSSRVRPPTLSPPE